MKRGIATFTLDYGKCPPWLFSRMVKLGREIVRVMVEEYGSDEFIRRIADPVWFQALGTVLAFDWNASGLTTVLTGALKESLKDREQELGIFICGGKGKTSRKTPQQIADWGSRLSLPDQDIKSLAYNSKMSAKVDSALVQDGYQIYHHCFFFTPSGAWAVVQQGMKTSNATARRYHWHSESAADLINEPHSGISAQVLQQPTLDLSSDKSQMNRQVSVDLITADFTNLHDKIEVTRRFFSDKNQTLGLRRGGEELVLLDMANTEFGPADHPIVGERFWDSPYLKKIFDKLGQSELSSYEQLLATQGVGPKTIRALSLVSEVVHGAKPSYRDPARYSFAHGGKDGTPYPVDTKTYDRVIATLSQVVGKTKLDYLDKSRAIGRLQAAEN